ncbi:MAG: lipopolysaccharide assembly protein LapB [Thiobacillaceae bacterium]|jgi:lipopolysaccharide biosynthesis regulator YciM
MQFEFWWLLAFPLFFALGWLAARIDIKQVVTESRTVPNSYFRGLNFLLNEQPDKAIEAFIEVAKLDPETIDLHFALGGLFRKRGEVDRAIRMHENLLERATLDEESRLKALLELGQDYLKAGLLDRAEDVFQRLLETTHTSLAHKFLLEIYVQEKDWQKAIEAAEVLDKQSSKPMNAEIAHFYCELALIDTVKGDRGEAGKHLRQALNINRQSVRANMLMGDLEAAAGNHEGAINYWRQVESQSPAYMVLIVDKLLASFRALGNIDEGLAWLKGLLVRQPSLGMFNSLYAATLESQGVDHAVQLAQNELRRNPSLSALERLAEAELIRAPEERRELLQSAKSLIQSHNQKLMRYHCTGCGFRARQFFWRCPACGRWDSFDPERSEE